LNDGAKELKEGQVHYLDIKRRLNPPWIPEIGAIMDEGNSSRKKRGEMRKTRLPIRK